jgi:hypothetical protein
MPLQMQYQLQLEFFDIDLRRCDSDCKLLGSSGKCKLEHRFIDNPDLERF